MSPRNHRLFAAVYEPMLAPLERRGLRDRRRALLSDLRGSVLEVGAGTGANVPFYRDPGRLVLTEPDAAMRRRLVDKVAAAGLSGVEVVGSVGEDLPFPDGSFDVVVFTLVLCSVDDLGETVREARRVLTASGRLVLMEHVRAEGKMAWWQDHLTPVWSRLQAGCHLNRDTARVVRESGFEFIDLRYFQAMPSWIPASRMLHGIAEPRPSSWRRDRP